MGAGLTHLASAALDLHVAATARGDRRLAKEARRVVEAAARLERPPAATMRASVVKASDERRVAWFVVYSPNRLPARGADHRIDVVSPEVLERGAHRFAENGFRIGVGHRPGGEGVAKVVESHIQRGGSWRAVGPDGTEQVVKEGDWVIALRFSPKSWEKFKRGAWGGVSLQGSARRQPATVATLARQRS